MVRLGDVSVSCLLVVCCAVTLRDSVVRERSLHARLYSAGRALAAWGLLGLCERWDKVRKFPERVISYFLWGPPGRRGLPHVFSG